MKKAALVTLAIGEEYLARWKRYCEFGWRRYAERHGLDLIVLTEPIDRSERAIARSCAWQKCLVLSQDFVRDYRQVMLLDCDIVINHQTAPDITVQVSEEFIGGVVSGSQIQEDLRVVMLHRRTGVTFDYQRGLAQWNDDQTRFFEEYGLPRIDAGVIQTGVLVASPRHRDVFRAVYDTDYPVQTRSYEQMPLTHALHTGGLFRPIDTRFNSVFYETMLTHYPYLDPRILSKTSPGYDLLAGWAVNTQYYNNFFLHFAYDIQFMNYLSNANLFGTAPA
jgi:hypothetical protein